MVTHGTDRPHGTPFRPLCRGVHCSVSLVYTRHRGSPPCPSRRCASPSDAETREGNHQQSGQPRAVKSARPTQSDHGLPDHARGSCYGKGPLRGDRIGVLGVRHVGGSVCPLRAGPLEGPNFPSEDRDLPYSAIRLVKTAITRPNCAKLGKSQGSQPKLRPFSSHMRTGRARAGRTPPPVAAFTPQSRPSLRNPIPRPVPSRGR